MDDETIHETITKLVEQEHHLRELGCDRAQGYLYARPARADARGDAVLMKPVGTGQAGQSGANHDDPRPLPPLVARRSNRPAECAQRPGDKRRPAKSRAASQELTPRQRSLGQPTVAKRLHRPRIWRRTTGQDFACEVGNLVD